MVFTSLLIFSLALAQYNFGAPPPFVMQTQGVYCKNHALEKQGELSVPETLILRNPSNTIAGCAQAVSYSQGLCSPVFFSNGNQCACIRPGHMCKQDRSETGFSVYQMTNGVVLSKTKEFDCDGLPEDACNTEAFCQWEDNACVGIILQNVAGGMGYGMPGAMGAYGDSGAMGAPMAPYMTDSDCEREVDEKTSMMNVVDLTPSTTKMQCQTQVQTAMSRGICSGTFVWQTAMGRPGECSCLRVNTLCDEESRPGYNVYQMNAMGPYGAGMAGYSGRPMTGAGMTGYPPRGTTMGGAYPGMQMAGAGYPGMQMAGAGYPRMQMAGTGAYMPQAGTVGYRPGMQMAGYGQAGAAGYGQAGAYQAGMGYMPPHHVLSKPQTEQGDTGNGSSVGDVTEAIIFYAVIPASLTILIAALLCRICQRRKSQTFREHILMDDHRATVV